jgi:hypothetical protein
VGRVPAHPSGWFRNASTLPAFGSIEPSPIATCTATRPVAASACSGKCDCGAGRGSKEQQLDPSPIVRVSPQCPVDQSSAAGAAIVCGREGEGEGDRDIFSMVVTSIISTVLCGIGLIHYCNMVLSGYTQHWKTEIIVLLGRLK